MLTEQIAARKQTSSNPLDTFAKLFNTGKRRPTKSGDEWRIDDIDLKPKLALKIIQDNNLPLVIERSVELNNLRAFIVKEVI